MDETSNITMIERNRRIAEELLASTTFKDSLRLFLKNIDPEAAPALVRTLMGKDVEIPMAVISTLPVITNCLIKMAMEIVIQVRGKYPAPLLSSMTESLLEDVDRETLICLIKEIRGLGNDLAPAFNAFSQAIEEQSSKGKERI
ncbi:MAG TPA: hypothetical protein ENN05_13225 [Deltaproteobacteria bacterium]|nr:hypothetical protein [Deltaproteobacteria bacterium]